MSAPALQASLNLEMGTDDNYAGSCLGVLNGLSGQETLVNRQVAVVSGLTRKGSALTEQ